MYSALSMEWGWPISVYKKGLCSAAPRLVGETGNKYICTQMCNTALNKACRLQDVE
jgi:hypothetical protein